MTEQTELSSEIVAEIDANPAGGDLARGDDGRWTLTMDRVLPHAPERVWPWLTDPARLARWSPLKADRRLDTVGPAQARETSGSPVVDATVLHVDAPRELVHHWGEHLLRWTLTAVPDGTRLRIEHTFAERAEASSFGGGWHICLAALAAGLSGADVDSPVGDRALDYGWATLRDACDAQW